MTEPITPAKSCGRFWCPKNQNSDDISRDAGWVVGDMSEGHLENCGSRSEHTERRGNEIKLRKVRR